MARAVEVLVECDLLFRCLVLCGWVCAVRGVEDPRAARLWASGGFWLLEHGHLEGCDCLGVISEPTVPKEADVL